MFKQYKENLKKVNNKLRDWGVAPKDGEYQGGDLWVAYYDNGTGYYEVTCIEKERLISGGAWNIGDTNMCSYNDKVKAYKCVSKKNRDLWKMRN